MSKIPLEFYFSMYKRVEGRTIYIIYEWYYDIYNWRVCIVYKYIYCTCLVHTFLTFF